MNYINSKINTLQEDRQLYTPEAVFWTIILCLPMTLVVLVGLIVITFICFNDPEKILGLWSVRMSGYWWLFAFMLAMLRPNGLAYRHFSMPKHNVELFSNVMKRSVWITVLWLNASMFTYLDGGIANDVIGQLMTIAVLVISLFIIGPRMRYAVQAYEKTQKKTFPKSFPHCVATLSYYSHCVGSFRLLLHYVKFDGSFDVFLFCFDDMDSNSQYSV